MKNTSTAEKIFIDNVSKAATSLQQATRGLSIGEFIKIIRQQLKMSQQALAKRAKTPQSTISRIEQGQKDASQATLLKILEALSCELVIAPKLREPIDTIRHKQATKVAKKHTRYLQGTMNLEEQEPDTQLLQKLTQEEEHELLQKGGTKLWDEE